ncbi:MAG: OsmC family protein [Planctomycetota bacterium]|jgi:putative redox protein
MVEMTGMYLGDLRCEIVHGPSGTKLLTDAPKDNEGLGRSFSPTDCVAAALGTCVVTILGIVAQRLAIDIAGARFAVTKEMGAHPKRHIEKIGVVVRLPAHISPEDRDALETAACACPVEESLAEGVETPIGVVYE